ncbi:hypothetical protein O3G_MSEX010862 [Manduca sexta]|uniref:Uncharacterized protein n=1 Tax=Manduca sexta TaxID=7130 RepID=A0A921ZI24_MANSE|nr:hypothetical protein O3G_MSEX010862 [Manduca sexta]
MLSLLCFILLLSLTVSQFEFSYNRDTPTYIKKALREKNMYRPRPHQKKTTISNLTLKQVFNKIKDITRALNSNAKKNGYKVDYKFRILNNN